MRMYRMFPIFFCQGTFAGFLTFGTALCGGLSHNQPQARLLAGRCSACEQRPKPLLAFLVGDSTWFSWGFGTPFIHVRRSRSQLRLGAHVGMCQHHELPNLFCSFQISFKPSLQGYPQRTQLPCLSCPDLSTPLRLVTG